MIAEIAAERERQRSLHDNRHRTWELPPEDADALARLLALCRQRQALGDPAWAWVVLEEALEAVLAPSADERRTELVQLAALCVQCGEGPSTPTPDADAAPLGVRLCPVCSGVAHEGACRT